MPDPATLRWVLLDLDDTLVDTQNACYQACQAAARELALPLPREDHFHRLYGRLDFPECVAAWCGPEHFADFNRVYLHKVRYTAIGAVGELLAQVKRTGLRAGLVTNSSPGQVERKLSDARVPRDRLDFVMTPADLPMPKPDKSAFVVVLERHGIDPAQAVYVSDHPADGRGARAAGLAFSAVLTGAWTAAEFQAEGTPAQHVFPTVHDALRTILATATATATADSRALGGVRIC
jgi:HAD superfamily hydrolase (TIGR01509 family)